MCTMALNPSLNGVELYFENKPESSIIAALKEAGYRWHNIKKCWYAKQTSKTMAKATELAEGELETFLASEPVQYSEPFFPDYENVDGYSIYKASDVSILDNKRGYYADINVCAWVYDTSAGFIDLTNAMKPGKECDRYAIFYQNWSLADDNVTLCLYNKFGIKTVKDLYEKVISGAEFGDIYVEKTTIKSSKVFSPFVMVKPIKTPEKWTKAHVWKAILAGQIFRGETDYHYTDDYAYDAAYNYNKGRSIHLEKLAKELIEDGNGISVFAQEKKGSVIPVSVSTYSFDSKTVYFDETCNHKRKKELLWEMAESKKKHNDDLLSKVMDIKESDIQTNSIYSIEYLEMDNNTGLFEIEKKLKYGSGLFYEGECDYQIVKMERFIPDNRTLYSLSDFYNRPSGDRYNDKRIIDMGNWQYVVTGYALKELVSEGNVYDTICEAQPRTIEAARHELNGRVEGRIKTLFCKDETDYSQSLFRLNAEEMRIQEDDNSCLIYQ